MFMLGLIASIIIAFFSMFIPGVLLAYALLSKTELNHFEIIVIGFIFGLIAPATMTWLESYLMTSIHALTFSLWLFELNALILTIIGAILCYREGLATDFFLLFASKSSKAKEASTSNDLTGVRAKLSKFHAGREIIRKHMEEESTLKTKQSSERSPLSNLTEEERAKIESLHRESVRAFKRGATKRGNSNPSRL